MTCRILFHTIDHAGDTDKVASFIVELFVLSQSFRITMLPCGKRRHVPTHNQNHCQKKMKIARIGDSVVYCQIISHSKRNHPQVPWAICQGLPSLLCFRLSEVLASCHPLLSKIQCQNNKKIPPNPAMQTSSCNGNIKIPALYGTWRKRKSKSRRRRFQGYQSRSCRQKSSRSHDCFETSLFRYGLFPVQNVVKTRFFLSVFLRKLLL